VLAVHVDHGGVDHLSNVSAVQRRPGDGKTVLVKISIAYCTSRSVNRALPSKNGIVYRCEDREKV
jgi:hypothetical protein